MPVAEPQLTPAQVASAQAWAAQLAQYRKDHPVQSALRETAFSIPGVMPVPWWMALVAAAGAGWWLTRRR